MSHKTDEQQNQHLIAALNENLNYFSRGAIVLPNEIVDTKAAHCKRIQQTQILDCSASAMRAEWCIPEVLYNTCNFRPEEMNALLVFMRSREVSYHVDRGAVSTWISFEIRAFIGFAAQRSLSTHLRFSKFSKHVK